MFAAVPTEVDVTKRVSSKRSTSRPQPFPVLSSLDGLFRHFQLSHLDDHSFIGNYYRCFATIRVGKFAGLVVEQMSESRFRDIIP